MSKELPATPAQIQKRILGLPKNIFVLGLTSFFNDFSSEMIFAVFPAFFTSVLHAGAASLGLVDGVAEAASNIFKIYSGNLSDRVHKRKLLVVCGYALSVAARPFYLFVGTVTGVLGLRFLDRVGKGVRDAPRDAIISLSSPPAEMGRSFGYHRAMDTTGAILGPLAAYLILLHYPGRFDHVFTTAFIAGLAVLATLVFVTDVTSPFSARRASLMASFRAMSSKFKWFLAVMFILSVGSLPVAIVLLKTTSAGLAVADIPLFYMIYSISYALFSMAAGKVSDAVGPRRVIFAGYLVLAVSYILIDRAAGVWGLIAGFFVFGLFPALTDGVQRALASELTAADVRGGGLGLLHAATGFGALVAGVVGGFIWQMAGSAAAFLAATAVIAAGLLLFGALFRTPARQ